MRILLSTISGHDKSESAHVRRVLARMGHDVTWASIPCRGEGPEYGIRVTPGFALGTAVEHLALTAAAPWDLFLYIEPQGFIPEGIERAPFPTACVISDVHTLFEPRRRLARFFDHVFLYHRNYLDRFDEHPKGHVHWWPVACDVETFKPAGVVRDLDVASIGQLFGPASERRRLTAALSARFGMNEQRWYLQDEIPGVYSRAKIVVNMPLADDLNFRFFEALSCGAMLITRRDTNGQEDLFEENVHYVAFDGEAELLDKVSYYLAHDEERETIAAAGRAEMLRKHTLEHRLRTLLETVQRMPKRAAPIRRMAPGAIDDEYVRLYEYWGSLDAGARRVGHARKAGRRWVPLLVPAVRTFLRATLR